MKTLVLVIIAAFALLIGALSWQRKEMYAALEEDVQELQKPVSDTESLASALAKVEFEEIPTQALDNSLSDSGTSLADEYEGRPELRQEIAALKEDLDLNPGSSADKLGELLDSISPADYELRLEALAIARQLAGSEPEKMKALGEKELLISTGEDPQDNDLARLEFAIDLAGFNFKEPSRETIIKIVGRHPHPKAKAVFQRFFK